MSDVQNLLVVEVNSLNLSQNGYDKLSDFYEACSDTYHRYYPDKSWNYLDEDVKKEVNLALQKCIVFPDVMYRPVDHPDGYYNWYILLHFG